MKKDITLKVFEINPVTPTAIELNLPMLVNKALDESSSIGSRAMQLNSLDPQAESDFVASFKKTKSTLFGCIVRMKTGDATHILKDQLQQKSIDLATLARESRDGVEGFIKDTTYFLMDKKHLLLKSGHLTKKSVQTYLNWLLRGAEGEGDVCDFKPMLSRRDGIQLSEVRSIEIQENHFRSIPEYKTVSRNLDNLKASLVRELVADAPDLEELLEDELISASIQLHFHVRKAKKTEDNSSILQALLNSTDSEDVKVSLKKGGTVVASTFEEKRTIQIELIDDVLINERELEAEMGKYARELT
jgi:hypothetical protein